MRVLGIDTATWRAAVGLWEDGAAVSDQFLQTKGNHAALLLGLIDSVLQEAGWKLSTLDAVAVAAGPGSFTGLRVGLTTAKGLAYASGVALVGVPTLRALASTVAMTEQRITPVLDARKGELYVASFSMVGGSLGQDLADCLLTPEQLSLRIPEPGAILGDAVLRYADTFKEIWGGRARVLPFEEFGPRGSVVAALGAERLSTVGADPIATLEPFYIRPSDAEVKRV